MRRPLLLSIVLFIVSIAVGVFMIWPNYQQLSISQQQLAEKEARLQIKENTLVELKELRKELGMYETELEKIRVSIPEDLQLPSLYDLVQSLSSLSGLLMQSISSSTEELSEETTSDLKMTGLSIRLSGSYEGLKEFLSRLNSSARVLNLQAITVVASGTEGEGLGIEAQIEAYSY